MPTTWSEIRSNFATLMETTIGGYTYAKVTDMSRLSTMPSSNWNKQYMVQMNGMPAPVELYNSVVDLNYSVRLQIAFKLNAHDNNASYNAAMEEVEEVIVKRLATSTWSATSTILNILHVDTSPVQFTLLNNSDEHFAVVNITFLVSGRQVIS